MEENTLKAHVEPAYAPPTADGSSSTLYVINLCASIAPLSTSSGHLPGLDNYRLYQVARVEDGRTRHRLRLGFFTSEAHAQGALAIVREQYPTAFTASLGDEDRRYTRGYLPQTSPTPTTPGASASPGASATPDASITPAASITPVASITPATSATPAVPATPATVARSTPASAQTAMPRSVQPRILSPAATPALTLCDPPVSARHPKPPTPARVPFHVGRGVEIGDLGITLQVDPPGTAAQNAAASSTATDGASGARRTEPTAATATVQSTATGRPAAAAMRASSSKANAATPTATVTRMPPAALQPPSAPAEAARPRAKLADLDSTQTLRALTSAELSGDDQEKWFAIQLAASEQPVNLEAMPHLDIFEAYRLYSVATIGNGKIVHSLRLGFFKEAVSAEAVSGYLKTFFGSPLVMRVSIAEHARFKDPPLRARNEAAPKHDAQILDLGHARAPRSAIPTVTMEAPAPRIDASTTGSFEPNATGSFKSGTTGSFRLDEAGSPKMRAPTLEPTAKAPAPATRRGEPLTRKSSVGSRHKAVRSRKTLDEELLEEAREVELSESSIRKLPKNHSLLSRLVGRLTR